jgi:hypothetical protein
MFRKALACTLIFAGYALAFPFVSSDVVRATPPSGNSGGPIVLDGMDPVCHASYGETTDRYIAKVIKSVYDKSIFPSNNGKIAILGASSLSSAAGCGGNWNTLLSTKFLTGFSTQPTVQFFNTTTEIDTFFAGINTSAPRVLWIPDDWSRSAAVSAKFTANAEKIADYVNSGGGLFANSNTYGWLTTLLPNARFNNGGCNGGPNATADGASDFGLTNTDVAACWHGYFTGDVGTLKTLASWRYPDASTGPLVAVSVGGGEVSLPSSFTLTISPQNPEAGQDLTITALAQTLAGVAQSGVTVTVTVSSGPDAGQVLTATTNASGVATITVRTASVGTNIYTATATVNGVSKTVSATVSWLPPVTTTTLTPPTTTLPPTTTAAPTTTVALTTTLAPTTTVVVTTSVAPSTTAVAETTSTTTVAVVPESPPTTVHDHSTHDHGLPVTGSDNRAAFFIGLLLIIIGCFLVLKPKGFIKN